MALIPKSNQAPKVAAEIDSTKSKTVIEFAIMNAKPQNAVAEPTQIVHDLADSSGIVLMDLVARMKTTYMYLMAVWPKTRPDTNNAKAKKP